MTRFFLAGAAFCMMASAAMAQSTVTDQTTTTTAVPAPVTTSTSHTSGASSLSDGRQTITSGSGVSDSNGNANATVTTKTTYPFSNIVTTKQKQIDAAGGVTKQTDTTTNAYPQPNATVPPVVSSTTTVR